VVAAEEGPREVEVVVPEELVAGVLVETVGEAVVKALLQGEVCRNVDEQTLHHIAEDLYQMFGHMISFPRRQQPGMVVAEQEVVVLEN